MIWFLETYHVSMGWSSYGSCESWLLWHTNNFWYSADVFEPCLYVFPYTLFYVPVNIIKIQVLDCAYLYFCVGNESLNGSSTELFALLACTEVCMNTTLEFPSMLACFLSLRCGTDDCTYASLARLSARTLTFALNPVPTTAITEDSDTSGTVFPMIDLSGECRSQ